MTARVLVVDDDAAVRSSLGLLLKQAGYRVTTATDTATALAQLQAQPPDCVIQDMNFGRHTDGADGFELLAALRERQPDLPVILITAWATVSMAVKGMRAGAADFITKPWSHEQVRQSVATALGLRAWRGAAVGRHVPDRATLDRTGSFPGVVGNHPSLLELLDIVARTAHTDAGVLITGESGTGKEVIAEAIWQNSTRRQAPLVKVNLGGLSGPLFDSEMFGHVRGAFTDARSNREGRFERAQGGTIFLDEVGDLDPACQVKLLRVLQDQSYRPVGASRSEQADVRVVSATNRELAELVAAGEFREDLFYRLKLITVRLPPLRERRSDIALIATRLIADLSSEYGFGEVAITSSAREWLTAQSWPGNIRQLKQVLERTLLLVGKPVLDLGDFLSAAHGESDTSKPGLGVDGLTLEQIERHMIQKLLELHKRNISRVARALGLSRASLYRRLEKFGLASDNEDPQ